MTCAVTSAPVESAVDPYSALNGRARRALARAEFRKAEKLFEWAYVEARRRGAPGLEERAFCNRAVAAATNGSIERYLPGMRAILARSPERENRFLAAYDLAMILETGGFRDQARFFARIAVQLAADLDQPLNASAALFQLGKLRLGDSRLQRAQRAIEEAIRLLGPEADPVVLALQSSVLGYCLARLEQPSRAIALLEGSVDTIDRCGYRLYEPAARLNLGFSLLEMEEFEGAGEQAERILSLSCCRSDRKYALYLAGETSGYLGEFDLARDRFRRLQEEFFPEIESLADELCATPTHGVISWLA